MKKKARRNTPKEVAALDSVYDLFMCKLLYFPVWIYNLVSTVRKIILLNDVKETNYTRNQSLYSLREDEKFKFSLGFCRYLKILLYI